MFRKKSNELPSQAFGYQSMYSIYYHYMAQCKFSTLFTSQHVHALCSLQLSHLQKDSQQGSFPGKFL